MTLENTGVSARLWNTCAKGGERPSRQGAVCQWDRVSEEAEEMCRAAEGGVSLHPELLSGVLALWVHRENVELTSVVLLQLEMLSGPHTP